MKFVINRKLFCSLLATLFLFCAACNQDPIFYAIYQEVKLLPPRVAGTPSAMVLFNREYPSGSAERVPVAYIASATTLYWFAKPDNPELPDTSWSKGKGDNWWKTAKGQVEQPGGERNILGLATDGDYLYALYQKQLMRIKWDSAPDAQWEKISFDATVAGAQSISFDTIYSSNNRIFIGGRLPEKEKSIPCAILYVTTANTIAVLSQPTPPREYHLLRGVAFNGSSYYFCTNNLYASGGAIFKMTSPPESAVIVEILKSDDPEASDFPFTGIISLEDGSGGANHTIVAMDRRGMLYTIDNTGDTFISTGKSTGRSTGALALWRNPKSDEWDPDDPSTLPKPALLLAGFQGELVLTTSTGYTNGYFELGLNWKADGTLDITSEFTKPGELDVSTVDIDSNERYQSTIGKYPISGFFQTPREIDENMTLFASTVNEGLWSYRGRSGDWQWNAEE